MIQLKNCTFAVKQQSLTHSIEQIVTKHINLSTIYHQGLPYFHGAVRTISFERLFNDTNQPSYEQTYQS